MKTNIAIIRDHSGSMNHLRSAALNDFNSLLASLKQSAVGETYLTAIECGGVNRLTQNLIPLHNVQSISYYTANGGTPLLDAVQMAIDSLSANNYGDNVANLVMVITDGEENASHISPALLKERIVNLQNSDRWTFTFRVPKGYGDRLSRMLGLHSGNIIEWEQNEKALYESSIATQSAATTYFAARSRGKTSVNTFYANPADITNIQKKLTDVSDKYKRHTISPHQDGISIQDFCIEKTGKYELGRVFYSLNKSEKVQPNKDIVIRDTVTGEMYGGAEARDLIGLPQVGTVTLAPGNMGKYEVFIRSTSNNRKLYANNGVLVRA